MHPDDYYPLNWRDSHDDGTDKYLNDRLDNADWHFSNRTRADDVDFQSSSSHDTFEFDSINNSK